MTEDIKQDLSALMDGELPRDATRFLLRRIESDGVLRATWSRYQTMRLVLRRQQSALPAPGFAEAVMARIAVEPTMRTAQASRWLKVAGGSAIAAGVAVAALMVSRPVSQLPANLPVVTDTRPASVATDTNFLQPSPPMLAQPAAFGGSDDASAPVGIDPRLQSYLIRHYEATGGNGRSGLAPYVLLVVPARQAPASQPSAAQDAPQ